MQTLVIGIGHKSRHGKDTAAQAIIAQRANKYDVRRYAFADELKREVNEAAEAAGGMNELFTRMHLTLELPHGVQFEIGADMTDPFCPLGKHRALLQWWGTEYRRAQDPFYWVRKLALRIADDKPQFALISDMRFPNEAMWVKANEGYTVNVTRHGYRMSEGIEGHYSDVALDSYAYDYKITVGDSEEGLSELRKDILTVFDMIAEINKVPDYHTEDFTQEGFGANVEEGVPQMLAP